MAAEALEMTDAPATYPSPGSHCLACEFMAPCLTMYEGADPEPLLAAHFHRPSGDAEQKPRLGPGDVGLRQRSGAAGLVSAIRTCRKLFGRAVAMSLLNCLVGPLP